MEKGKEIELEDDQKFALMKFRRNVADILKEHHDDQYLLRWLRARSWNTEAAEKMLRQSMKWRMQWEVDTNLQNWEPPEALKIYYPSGCSGFSKNGSPVIVVPFAGLDIIGLLHSASRQDMVRLTIKLLEKYMNMARETNSNQVVPIFDMQDFSLRQYAWRPAAEVIIALIQMYEANYPEILKACFIINAPRVFAIAFNVVKKFLNEYTLSKIKIFKNDPKKWKPAILEVVSPENLPKYYGGTLCDSDGNPKYISKINQGGKVPKTYYTKNLQDKDSNKREYTSAVIKKGEKLSLDFDVNEDGCFLRWDFRTEDHDIRFGVILQDSEGKSTPVVRHMRVAAHQIDESGVIACQAPATYTVTFDNSYSLMRGKKIHYSVYVTPPIGVLDMNAKENAEEALETLEEGLKGEGMSLE